MAVRTLTLEVEAYGLAVLVLYSLSSASLAWQLCARWARDPAASFLPVHLGVMAITVAWGSLIVDPRPVLGRAASAWALSLPLGVVVGLCAYWSDRAILRRLSRRRLRTGGPAVGPWLFRRPGQPGARLVGGDRRSRWMGGTGAPVMLGLAAVLEELLFRGLLVSAALALPNASLTAAALAATVAVFALSHVQFGWPQVLAKLPLGTLAMAATLSVHTVAPAVVAHVLFNLQTWSAGRAMAGWWPRRSRPGAP